MTDVTRILNAIEQGDPQATEELLPLVYEELRLMAAQKMSQEPLGQTLQATALVHEAYLRLVGAEAQSWDSCGHFFAAAAEAMRRILIENARRKKSFKYGRARHKVDLNSDRLDRLAIRVSADDLFALNEALDKLEHEDRCVADLFKLRYFVGLTFEQAAETLGVSRRSVYRYWAYARAWLHQELNKGG